MSSADDPRRRLAAKKCADRAAVVAPVEIFNPPGRDRLDYRVGTRASLLARMLEALPLETLPDGPNQGTRPLAELASRDLDDPAIALLDAWAKAGDVITFYQERFANEAFLRSAGERRSLLELAALVGYELSPGVAASAFLAFTVQEAPGSPTSVVVPAGTRVQSIPGQDELPQTFETSEEITARAGWNTLVPRPGLPQPLAGAERLLLGGEDTRLAAGDLLLVVVERDGGVLDDTALARVRSLTVDSERGFTTVALEAPLAFRSDVAQQPAAQLFDRASVFALRQRAPVFGHNATPYGSLPKSDVLKDDPFADPSRDWDEGRTVWTDSGGFLYGDGSDPARPALFLDRKLEGLVSGGWAVLVGDTLAGESLRRPYRLTGVSEASLADYALSAESSGLALAEADGSPLPAVLADRPAFDFRRATVYLDSEELTLAQEPIEVPYPSPEIEPSLASVILDRRVEGLRPGQPLVVRGERADGSGAGARAVLIDRVDNDSDPQRTRLIFQQGMDRELFDRPTVTLNANVVLATHGESTGEVGGEVLGSGDADQANQSFTLDRSPLTFLSAPVPGGSRSTLEVRVDGVRWREVDTLHGEGAGSQSYTVDVDDDGVTTVTFGDGVSGARLPSGSENVTATYRAGIGPAGEVGADTLALLATRPLGISEVTNPVAAAGAAPPESGEEARDNAPVTARTLGRVVSLADFEDFARTFAGIGRVRAAPVLGVHLTVAGVEGKAVARGSALYNNLLEAIEVARLPGPPLRIDSYQPLPVDVEAQLVIDSRFRPEDVFEAVEAALLDAFSFERREFAQPLWASDVLDVIQSTAGVVAVDVDRLYLAGSDPALATRLEAQPARAVAGRIQPAQMLLINPGGVTLRARTP